MAFEQRQASSSTSRRGLEGRGATQPNAKVDRVKSNLAKRQRIDRELAELESRVDRFIPPSEISRFAELPLSARTLKGLRSSHFLTPTPIQSLAIPPALQSRDVLGSAKTGSGKTLAFLVPLLERLYLLKWGPMDGLGAVVISPTRELAVQTFNQLRDIGKYHSFSAGLVIGGRPLKEESDRVGRMNILVATPGRLLQHLDGTVGFDSAGVKCLVLDEADRLLDLGFLPALRAIVSHFTTSTKPGQKSDRQTLLFSATQTADLASLATLSLHDPLYLNCNKPGEEGVVPSNLHQSYAVVGLERKLDALWGFVRSHLKMKGVVFVTSGKQVRFVFETFKRLHPGLPLMHLHGKQKQPTRLSIFQRFSTSKSALLICTDVAARGLDFPSVDWVIQLDCPDDVDTYIHRVGRTARYQSEGKALCILCPSEEEGMDKRWREKGLEVKKIRIKENKMGDLKQQMQNFAFKEPEIKYLGQRAFISYMRSVHIQKDKTVFKLSELPAEAYAASLGLPGAPRIKLLDTTKGGGKAKPRGPSEQVAQVAVEDEIQVVGSSDESDGDPDEGEFDEDEEVGEVVDDVGESHESVQDQDEAQDADSRSDDDEKPSRGVPVVRTKYDRMFERKNQSILAPHYAALVAHDDDNGAGSGDDADDVFTLARRDHELDDDVPNETLVNLESNLPQPSTAVSTPLMSSDDLSKRKLRAAGSKKAMLKTRPVAEKLVFDDEGHARDFYEAGQEAERGAGMVAVRQGYVEAERARMREADKVDRQVAREARKDKKRKRKDREREREQEAVGVEDEDGPMAIIGGADDMSDDGNDKDVEKPVRGKKRRKESGMEDDEALALRLLIGQ